jgi:hypothetical protein
MKLAIMQPYIFPYIGYFQLINTVDTFVFYDDVNYIKGGWINRNKILVNKAPYLFSIALNNSSSFIAINQTKLNSDKFAKGNEKLLRTIEQSYKKAPYFDNVFPLINDFLLDYKKLTISDLAIDSVLLISKYLELKTEFKVSSLHFPETKGFDKIDRLIEICKKEQVSNYVNPIGGLELYDKNQFRNHNLKLNFLKSNPIEYKQFNNEFVPWLSILDVMMFNSKTRVLSMLNEYELE